MVDMREESPTFMNWKGVELSAAESKQVFIPAGCAHGFYAYEDNTILLYTQEGTFDPSQDINFNHADPAINITWPKPSDGAPHVLSSKDLASLGAITALGMWKEELNKEQHD